MQWSSIAERETGQPNLATRTVELQKLDLMPSCSIEVTLLLHTVLIPDCPPSQLRTTIEAEVDFREMNAEKHPRDLERARCSLWDKERRKPCSQEKKTSSKQRASSKRRVPSKQRASLPQLPGERSINTCRYRPCVRSTVCSAHSLSISLESFGLIRDLDTRSRGPMRILKSCHILCEHRLSKALYDRILVAGPHRHRARP